MYIRSFDTKIHHFKTQNTRCQKSESGTFVCCTIPGGQTEIRGQFLPSVLLGLRQLLHKGLRTLGTVPGSRKSLPLQNTTLRRHPGMDPVKDPSTAGGIFSRTPPSSTIFEGNHPRELHLLRLQPCLPTKSRLEGVGGKCGSLNDLAQRCGITRYAHPVVGEGKSECDLARYKEVQD